MTTLIRPASSSFPVGAPTLTDFELLPTNGLQGVWEFLEGSGTAVADLSGISGPATITPGGGAWATGGFALDGSSSVILLPISALNNYTWAAVFKGDASGGASQGVVASCASPYSTSGNNLLWQKSNDQFYHQRVSSAGNNSAATGAAAGASGAFCPVLASASGNAFDVLQLATGNVGTYSAAGTMTPGALSVFLGRNAASTGPGYSYVKGTIAYFIAWNRQLSGAVVTPGVPSERQKVLTWLRTKMAARSITI